MKSKSFWVLFVILLLPSIFIKAQQTNNPTKEVVQVEVTSKTQIRAISGLVYSQPISRQGSKMLKMNLIYPDNRDTKILHPAIIYFPGGGFKTSNLDGLIMVRVALAKAGFVVASAEYRGIPEPYPALIEDAKAAIRYLRAHAAEFDIDPNRIGVIGDSAGGYVAQMIAVTGDKPEMDKGNNSDQSSTVQAVATLYGISNLTNIGEGYSEDMQLIHKSPLAPESLILNGISHRSQVEGNIMDSYDRAIEASPVGHIRKGLPPFLVMHGSKDNIVSPHQSEQLYNELKAVDNDVTYIIIEGGGHGDAPWHQEEVINRIVGWFKEHLIKK